MAHALNLGRIEFPKIAPKTLDALFYFRHYTLC